VIAFAGAKSATALTDQTLHPLVILLVQGCVAALIGHRFGLAKWWIPVQIILPPATLIASAWQVPPWIFLIAFIVLLLVYWNTARNRVPLYLTNRTTWAALEDVLPQEKGGRFIDIGCGIGGALLYLARRRPDMTFVGIESAPLPFALAWFRRLATSTQNLELKYGDFWKEDLSNYDIAYAFLSPEPMPRLFEKARAEMKPETLLISNSFVVPDHPASEIISVDDSRETQLHLWRN
jgi:SAM-dependent methyltransferase